jgi:hypothetical protein
MPHSLGWAVFALTFVLFTPAYALTDSLSSLATTRRTISESDPGSVELGVKFTGRVSGTVSKNRFYKGTQNTGRHTVNLW